MNEARLYELLGRKQARLEELHEEYLKLLRVLDRVSRGEVETDRILVLPDDTWRLLPDEVAPQ